jgi:putative transposase
MRHRPRDRRRIDPQLDLPRTSGWGGRRPRAGRRTGPHPRVLHRSRPAHSERHPAHVTLRARREVASLRAPRVHEALLAAVAAAQRDSFRVVHYSAQEDHLHLVVEASDGATLSAGIRGLEIRAARAVNRALGRRGPVWSDRYHRRDLTTPREVRNALAYVLGNARKHHPGVTGIDECSSAAWFDGWRRPPAPRCPWGGSAPGPAAASPVRAARTWLLSAGWRRHGLLDPRGTPGPRESWRRVAARRGWRLVTLPADRGP